jgi:glutamate/tyrosine decarboxylase-like PLP-dependent enzyme
MKMKTRTDPSRLMLEAPVRKELWSRTINALENYALHVNKARVSPELDLEKIRSIVEAFDFENPLDPMEAIDFIVHGLWQYQVHTPHPRYFGLFNPAPATMGIAADALVAAFNPQVATWSHSPLAAEIERHLMRSIGSRFGYDLSQTDGTFCSGGAEANHTAILTALVSAFPSFATSGLRGLEAQPVLYVSNQSHHSFFKAARLSGLGTDSVREIPVNEDRQMDVSLLSSQISLDRHNGLIPFMVVATAGTTSAGIVDPIASIGRVADDNGLWFHVDAAWGGAAVLVPELGSLLDGIERADSITFDAHKWLSVPMAAGIFLTRHKDILDRTYRITTDYMPRDAAQLPVSDPYTHSMQWSRRFIGLKVFLSLAVAGWKGYETSIRHQVEMGRLLRRELEGSQWKVINRTDLPLVCFIDQESQEGQSRSHLERVAAEVVSSGKAWISTALLDEDTPVLRACITNYRTEAEDVIALVHTLNKVRQKIMKST